MHENGQQFDLSPKGATADVDTPVYNDDLPF